MKFLGVSESRRRVRLGERALTTSVGHLTESGCGLFRVALALK